MVYAFWQRPVQQCALQMSKNAQMVLLSPVIQRMGASSQLAQQPALERMRRSRPVELHVRAHVRCLHQSAPSNACSVVSARPSTSVTQMVYAFWQRPVQQCALQMSKTAQMVLLSPVIQRMGASSQLAVLAGSALERMRR